MASSVRGGAAARGPHAYDGDNALLDGLDAAALRRVAALTGPAAPVMVVTQLNHLGGALASGPAGAVGHREARFALRVLSPLGEADPEGDLATVRAVHAEALGVVEPWRLGRSVNFVLGARRGRADAAEVGRSTHGAPDRARLAGLRAAHDPENVFRCHVYDGA
ncbi:hypothetical protein ACFC0M_35230 [Streptomyces sp. NPDC056149]|uniref:hypothetical protein n=1 Tax=Streptomyces sp. NPDC056149 TaxID=3345728 RepID=UPI0035D8AA59